METVFVARGRRMPSAGVDVSRNTMKALDMHVRLQLPLSPHPPNWGQGPQLLDQQLIISREGIGMR
jgi:hypothetical protein